MVDPDALPIGVLSGVNDGMPRTLLFCQGLANEQGGNAKRAADLEGAVELMAGDQVADQLAFIAGDLGMKLVLLSLRVNDFTGLINPFKQSRHHKVSTGAVRGEFLGKRPDHDGK